MDKTMTGEKRERDGTDRRLTRPLEDKGQKFEPFYSASVAVFRRQAIPGRRWDQKR